MPVEKHCKECKIVKKADAFSVVTSNYKGKITKYLNSYCRDCCASRFRARYVAKPRIKRPSYLYFKDTKKIKERKEIAAHSVMWSTYEPTAYVRTHKEYPTCSKGHSYVGERCLMCKYSLQTTARLV